MSAGEAELKYRAEHGDEEKEYFDALEAWEGEQWNRLMRLPRKKRVDYVGRLINASRNEFELDRATSIWQRYLAERDRTKATSAPPDPSHRRRSELAKRQGEFVRKVAALAQGLLNSARRSGLVRVPSRCAWCDAEAADLNAHHPDYLKPFDVVWLCDRCHGETHVVTRAAMRESLLVDASEPADSEAVPVQPD